MSMILDHLDSIIPRWMLDAASVQFSRLMATVASLGDAMTEAVLEARFAFLPGQLDVPGGNGFDNFDALPFIGHDRQIRQGFEEDDFEYAARLRAYQDEWKRSATPYELLNQLAAILSPNPPTLRLVNGTGTWWQRDPSGTVTQLTAGGSGFLYQIDASGNGVVVAESGVPHAWDWDSAANPHPFGFGDASRFWIIIYAPCNLPLISAISGHIGDGRFIGVGKGGPDATTIGTVAPHKEAEIVRDTVQTWRAAGLRCSHVIVVFGLPTDYFNPDGSSPDYPDGTWGWPCKIIGGQMAPARVTYARFGRAEPGGIAGTL